MKYVALLRGINVGGNSIIKMADLKQVFEKCGLKNVITFIQSGNVIFEDDKHEVAILEKKLEDACSSAFNYNSTIVIISFGQLKRIMREIPREWKNGEDLRMYMAFVKNPTTAEEVAKEIIRKENIDFLKVEQGILYMTTRLSGITKSGFSKLASKKIYKQITIKNYNTVQKLLSKMATR